MALIETHDLQKCFGEGNACTWALNGIDLEIEGGRYCVMEGRSGSGKSTLLNCIGALELPTSGRVTIAGQDLQSLSPDQRT
ncbi:MAG: ATP-binding cassette domain-containing protein, partial [Pseudomonadota bacterium]